MAKRIVRLTESDINKLVTRVIKEQITADLNPNFIKNYKNIDKLKMCIITSDKNKGNEWKTFMSCIAAKDLA
jgi:hypothetical protein